MSTTANTEKQEEVTSRRSHPIHRVAVKDMWHVTPRRRRFVFTGEALASLRVEHPGQWIKLFVPNEDTPAARVYTILAFHPEAREMVVDFFLHDGGTAAAWAAKAQVGDELDFAGPAGSFRIVEDKDWYLFVADDASLPAMLALVKTLPKDATAYLFIQTISAEERIPIPSQASLQITWVHQEDQGHKGQGQENQGREDASEPLLNALRQAQLPGGDCQAWIAGETTTVHTLRQMLIDERQFPRTSIHACGYWKRGQSNHRDTQGDR